MSSAAAKSQRQKLRMKATKRKTPELPSYVVEEHIDNLRAFVKLHKSKRGSPKMPAGKIRIFADCAGLSSETIALSLLGLTSEHMEFVGGSENDSAKRSMMQAVHKAFDLKTEKKLVEQDIFDRSLTETKSSDVYIAGFPCPAYSSCGRKLGAKDGQKRGLLIFEGLKYIVYRKPALVILENVSAFLNKRHARTHKVMKKCFAALGYKVYVKNLSTKEHGIPQSRSHCYLVAFRCDQRQKVSFKFPTCVLDVSPGQGEFLKASLASRTKAIAICGTEVHGSRLELLLTEYILSELSREGSTFYRPESVAKDEDETKKENKIDEAGSKKRTKNAAKPNPVEKKRRKNKDEENLEETKDEETEVKKTTNKKAKKNKQEDEQQDGEDSDEKSSECW